MAIHARDEGEAAFRWSSEEDYWVPAEGLAATRCYQEACAKHDPDHPGRRTRLDWPASPAWASPAGRK